jgi:hypothetical protein
MPRALLLLLAALAAVADGRRLDFSYSYPLYSPLREADPFGPDGDESRGYLSAGLLFEPTPFLAAGPRSGWSFWEYGPPAAEAFRLAIRKWEIGWSVEPHKQVAEHVRLFLEAYMGLQYLTYAIEAPVEDDGLPEEMEDALSESEWGYGRSLGMGLEIHWIRMSMHHDAFLAESLRGEFAGLRAAIGIVYRMRQ